MQGENENVRSVVYEEAGGIAGGEGEEVEVDEGWSRASSEPDQVWYRRFSSRGVLFTSST